VRDNLELAQKSSKSSTNSFRKNGKFSPGKTKTDKFLKSKIGNYGIIRN
jgi:hypothetical protein